MKEKMCVRGVRFPTFPRHRRDGETLTRPARRLTRLERDRIKARVHTLEAQVQQLQAEKAAATKAPATPKPPRPKRGADSKLPPRDSVPNPYASLTFDPPGIERYQLRRTFKGHVNAVSAAAFHPHKPILVRISASVSILISMASSRWRRSHAGNCLGRRDVEIVVRAELRFGHVRRGASGLDFWGGFPSGRVASRDGLRGQNSENMGFRRGCLRPHLLRPHASSMGLRLPPYRRLFSLVLDGPHD